MRTSSFHALDRTADPAAAQRLRAVGIMGAAMVAGVVLALLISHGFGRVAVAGGVLALIVGAAALRPPLAIALTVGFLILLGEIRRLLIPWMGWSGQDPLLMVAPAVAVLLVSVAVLRGEARLSTPLARWIAMLMAVMLLQMFNPLQGGLAVGVAGALFYMIPLCWYWVGRANASADLLDGVLYRVAVPLAAVAAVMGIYQAYYGLLPHQAAWVTLGGYEALSLSGTVRPFSIFPSAAEYTHFLGVGMVLIWAAWLRRQRVALVLLLPLLGWGILLAGTRTVVVTTLLAMTVLWAVQGRTRAVWLPRLGLAAVLAIGGVALSLGSAENTGEGAAAVALQHQMSGLRNPLDAEHSTARTHLSLFTGGIQEGFRQPLGYGLGATTIAAGKFGGDIRGTERDLSNLFVALGLGGILYAVVIGLVLIRAVRLWTRTRHVLVLGMLGALVAELFLWLYGGHYAIVTLLWLGIGMMDRFVEEGS
jgi:hypothetical protein